MVESRMCEWREREDRKVEREDAAEIRELVWEVETTNDDWKKFVVSIAKDIEVTETEVLVVSQRFSSMHSVESL